jgi:hypothetical protein
MDSFGDLVGELLNVAFGLAVLFVVVAFVAGLAIGVCFL